MPHYFTEVATRTIQPPPLLPVQGGVGVMGSDRLHRQWGNCKPWLICVDSFSIGETEVSVGLQRQVMGGVEEKAPDNYSAIFSWDENAEFCRRLSLMTGRPYGMGTEAEWEYAARDFVPDAQVFMEAHPELNLKTIENLRDWLVDEGSWLENPVVLEEGGLLTLQSKLVTDLAPDLTSPKALEIMKKAPRIGLWTVFAGMGDLNQKDFYYGQGGRGPVDFGTRNQKGIRRMTGGMWEWCVDVYRKGAYQGLPQENPSNSAKDPKDRSPRVRRGGSWGNVGRGGLRAACRCNDHPDERDDSFGARLFGPAGSFILG